MDSIRTKKKEFLLLMVCLLVGAALRFYTFDKRSLWMDEIYTLNDSKDGLTKQIQFYKENPTYLHPPLFFLLTHLFHPFTKPEKDLRIWPLVFGILSIPMIFFLSRLFSAEIALPCTISLTFMAYHVSLSQDGRAYSLVMFLGMASLYLFVKHLTTLKRRYLLLAPLFFALLFYTSYTAIPFVAFSQILWLYRFQGQDKRPGLSSLFLLNGLLLVTCIPWILFLASHYNGTPLVDPFHTEQVGAPFEIIYNMVSDWIPLLPLMITGMTPLVLFPVVSQSKANAVILLSLFILPPFALHFFCELFKITHFVSSRYFITFLPSFLMALFLAIDTIEKRFTKLSQLVRLRLLFLFLFILSNLVILHLYYRSEKQDVRGLVRYLKVHIQDGDKIFLESAGNLPAVLHYFGILPEKRHYTATMFSAPKAKRAYVKFFHYENKRITIYHSQSCCSQYITDGGRVWIVVGVRGVKSIPSDAPCIFKGFFDGSFLNFRRFPEDASLYLFLWAPLSPGEKGLEIEIK
jgi:uncharacterized membrane protein